MDPYADPSGVLFKDLGFFSQTDPDGASPYFDGLTNEQAFFLFTTNTYFLLPVNNWWHYFAPILDGGQTVDLNYTPRSWGEDFVQTASPYESIRFAYDYMVIWCDEEDVPYDDHLSDITVPVLNIVPAGGIGA